MAMFQCEVISLTFLFHSLIYLCTDHGISCWEHPTFYSTWYESVCADCNDIGFCNVPGVNGSYYMPCLCQTVCFCFEYFSSKDNPTKSGQSDCWKIGKLIANFILLLSLPTTADQYFLLHYFFTHQQRFKTYKHDANISLFRTCPLYVAKMSSIAAQKCGTNNCILLCHFEFLSPCLCTDNSL